MSRSLRGAVRRGLVLAASSAVALFAAGLFATPASAHTATIGVDKKCDTATGEWVLTWTVYNDHPLAATLDGVSARPLPIEGLGSELPAGGSEQHPTSISGTQRLGNTTKIAGLKIAKITWTDGFEQTKLSKTIELDGSCTKPTKPKPSAYLKSTCEGVTATLKNEGTAPATFYVYVKYGDSDYQKLDTVEVGPGQTEVVDYGPAEAAAMKAAAKQAAASDTPPAGTQVTLKVSSKYMDDVVAYWPPKECESPSPSASSPAPSPSVSQVNNVSPSPSSAAAQLPVTGSSVGGLFIAAVIAVGLGIALTVVARRRKKV